MDGLALCAHPDRRVDPERGILVTVDAMRPPAER
jgi:hypothetical protein